MVLCAGLGTRLRPLSDELAKPMVPVGDIPAVAHVVARVRLAVPARIVVNVHHRPDDVRAWAQGERIPISYEPELLGTAGGVARAAELLGAGDVLVWNGDILSDLEPRALAAAHDTGRGGHQSRATLAVRVRGAGEGNVGIDDEGRIVRLRAESFGRETRGADFLGIHVIGDSLRASLPETGCLVGDVYIPALRRGERLHAYLTDASFADVGSIPEYVAANARWLLGRNIASWAHPSATVNASIDGSVVGADAVIEAPALRSVVWAGARVTSPVADAVVTPNVVVPIPGTAR
jgi:mannose-1-phosphate guanylyltransferase